MIMPRKPFIPRRSLPAFLLLMLAALTLPWPGLQMAAAKAPFTLEAIHQSIEKRYPTVRHISGDVLAQMLAEKQPLLLLDVREKNEFDVSRLPGAIRVSPNIWHRPFMRRFAKQAKGKTVVFYCSVGERSSKLARYVQEALKQAGAGPIYNLKGGIFAWHNAKRKLVDHKGETGFVHPYNEYWGQLLTRPMLARYQPR